MALSDDIKERLDIVDVIGQYVPDLKRSGRNLTARCPFHQERTPSFVVFPERQSWRCFGACAEGGDLFTFVMKRENLDFVAVLRLLAQRAGLDLPQRRSPAAPRSPLYPLNDHALRYFQEALASERGSLARSYLRQRGVSDEAVNSFGLGYSPSTGDEMLRHLESLGFSREVLTTAGLITRGDGAPPHDMFRGRLMFPIRELQGQVVGFGGRSLDESPPKYLNTPQTPLFDKGHLLYALDLAKQSIAQNGQAVVVEGYMDVIAAHEHGFTNVVASMGTALTEHQVALLRRHARSFVLALDPDTAGQEATRRSLEGSWHLIQRQETPGRHAPGLSQRSEDLKALRIAVLPPGQDPDLLIREDAARWRRLIAEAVPVVEFLFSTVGNRLDLATSQGKAQAVDELFPLIAVTQEAFEQDRYFQRLAELLGVSPATLEASVGRPRPGLRRARSTPVLSALASPFRQVEEDPLEEHALALLVHYPELVPRASALSAEYLRRQENRALLSVVQQAGTIEEAYEQLDDHLAERLERLATRVLPPADRRQWTADFESCIRRLEERHLRELKAQEEEVLAQAPPGPLQDQESADALDRQMTTINQRLKELFTIAQEPPGGIG